MPVEYVRDILRHSRLRRVQPAKQSKTMALTLNGLIFIEAACLILSMGEEVHGQ